jgi:hypothetical protein
LEFNAKIIAKSNATSQPNRFNRNSSVRTISRPKKSLMSLYPHSAIYRKETGSSYLSSIISLTKKGRNKTMSGNFNLEKKEER